MIFAVGGVPILETHRLPEKDESPLQLVSAERLAYYLRIEAELAEMRRAAGHLTNASSASASP